MTDVADWWTTKIIRMEPGQIEFRGQPIEKLIKSHTFTQMIWLMVMGSTPSDAQARLLDAALVASVDHGPQAPSIAASRMAITCGVGINNAIASGVNMLGDVHGGAGEQALVLYQEILRGCSDRSLDEAIDQSLDALAAKAIKFVPGFGHRFHRPEDPRAQPLMELLRGCSQDDQSIDSRFADVAEGIQDAIERRKRKRIAMNIDGATAAIYGALGVPATLARGLFCLARSVGLAAHAHEQSLSNERNKGPTPPDYRWTYDPN
jgi:citrate synthase